MIIVRQAVTLSQVRYVTHRYVTTISTSRLLTNAHSMNNDDKMAVSGLHFFPTVPGLTEAWC